MFPYFETLLEYLGRGDRAAQQAWGQHVHWGYWENPGKQLISPEEFHRAAESMLKKMVQSAKIRNGMKILDVGCGLGGTIKFLNHEYHSCTFVGVNIDERQIKIGKTATVVENNNSVNFVKADAGSLPFLPEYFEVILCVESIFHFHDRQIFLHECERILKPGGVLVISDFVPIKYFGKWMNSAEQATHLVGRMYGELHTDISISQYRALARASGMECMSIEDITVNTLPTYRFLLNYLHSTGKINSYNRATFLLGLVSKMRLVRYLILAFRKPDRR
jgi:ubiquinone/menaquinone biosynthesis C-methylase UbiE